jgi:hypothetical protein
MNAELRTRSGELVHEFSFPDFQLSPEVAIWGSRIFILKAPLNKRSAERTTYYEALAGSVDASDAFAKLQNEPLDPPTINKVEPSPADRTQQCLTNGSPVTTEHREIDPETGQQKGYVVLTPEERAKGFVRPVRRTYTHIGGCGNDTTMGISIAETYARDPGFYSGTFCCYCREHRPLNEFVWKGTREQVGS